MVGMLGNSAKFPVYSAREKDLEEFKINLQDVYGLMFSKGDGLNG